MATITATVTIKGTRPLWWHKFGPDALPLDKRQERTGVAGNDPEEWRKSVLVTKDGQLFLEPTYVFGTLKDAAKYTKVGRMGSIQKSLAATLTIADTRILIDRWMPDFPNGHAYDPKTATPPEADPDAPVYLDIRGVVNPNTKSRNVRYRIAASPEWMATFHIQWDATIVSRGQMQSVCIDAGRLTGIGNGRTIGMGRFELMSFEVDTPDTA